MSKKLDSYRGRLSASAIAAGMNAARRNAVRLAADAAHLLEMQSFATAASVAILCIEEAGKLSILRSLALAKSDAEAMKTWKDFRSHTRKNLTWLLPQLVAEGAYTLEDFRPLFDEDSDHPFVLDHIKQLGFYTDCLGDAHWSEPADVIDERLARMLVQVAQLLSNGREHTEQEVQLWIEYMGPVWKKDLAWMKQALIKWYAAMQAVGLTPDGANKMEQFVRDDSLPTRD